MPKPEGHLPVEVARPDFVGIEARMHRQHVAGVRKLAHKDAPGPFTANDKTPNG